MIKALKYILLGFVQGISEILPISSSGHLMLLQGLLGLDHDALGMSIFLHSASLIALIFFMRKRLWSLIKGFFMYLKDRSHKNEFKYCLYIVISTIPAVIAGLFLKDLISFNSILYVGIALIINGILLICFSFFDKGSRKVSDMKWYNALSIGCFQCIGIIPGISRSGSCIGGGFSNKLSKEEAVDYAFMLFFPAILGSIVLEIGDIGASFVASDIIYYLLAFVVALVVTYFSFKLLLKIIKSKSLSIFSIYCFIIGGITVAYCLINGVY